MEDLDERRWYLRVYRAVRRKNRDTLLGLIRKYPQFHGFVGNAGDVVDVIQSHAPELLEGAFQAGLSPDAGGEAPPQTFLQAAAANGDVERLRLALKYGADTERRNDWGEVALGYACSWGQLEAVRLLVESGAQVNAVEHNPETGYWNTPLDCAGQYPDIASYLRSQGGKHLSELEPASNAEEPSRLSLSVCPTRGGPNLMISMSQVCPPAVVKLLLFGSSFRQFPTVIIDGKRVKGVPTGSERACVPHPGVTVLVDLVDR